MIKLRNKLSSIIVEESPKGIRKIRKVGREEGNLDPKAERLLRRKWQKLHERLEKVKERIDNLVDKYEYTRHLSDTRCSFLWEFNIKVIGIDFPESLEDKIDESTVYDIFWETAASYVESMAKELKNTYSWIDDVYQLGRMGGWLAICDNEFGGLYNNDITVWGNGELWLIDFDSVDDAIEYLREDYAYWDFNSVKELLEINEEDLKMIEDILSTREKDLPEIDKYISSVVRDFEEELSSEEFWSQYIEE